MKFNYNEITDIEFDGIDHKDAPDYVDAYICSASYKGEVMTDDQLDELNDDLAFVYEQLIKELF